MIDDSYMYQNLRGIITVIDDLRDVGLHHYINLPRICVVGTQSSGKSSVLESIVGIDFLPRGDGVVTRRPLELRLIHLNPSSAGSVQSYAVFDVQKDVKITDFLEVKNKIIEMTDAVAGKNRAIVDDPIVLSVYSTMCPDLTVIDLPGITRVPIKGSDQTDDIEILTREMALKYASDPRTIILAVIAANADMSTSDALQIARRVDPKGVRTIGVITKIDLMDRGTDAIKMLMGDDVPLRLGYTGVRNRSQADILNNMSVQQAIESEKLFFSSHSVYKTVSSHLLGTQALVEKLSKVLSRHIKNILPEIKHEINARQKYIQSKLNELGTEVPSDVQDQSQLIWSLITEYCTIMCNAITGKFNKKAHSYFDHQGVASGAQIRYFFNKLLEEYIDKDVTSELSDKEIDAAICMYEGDSLPGFPSPDTFECLIMPHLLKLRDPVFDLLDTIVQSMEELSEVVANRVFSRFPALSEKTVQRTCEIIHNEKSKTHQVLENVLTAETSYLFTNDSDYLINHAFMIPLKETNLDSGKPSNLQANSNDMKREHEKTNTPFSLSAFQTTISQVWNSGQGSDKLRYCDVFIKEIRSRLDAYFKIVLRHIRDIVPKVIGYFLIRKLQEKLQFNLYNDIKREALEDLLMEPSQVAQERALLVTQFEILNNASQILQKDLAHNFKSLEFDENFDFDLNQHLNHKGNSNQIPSRNQTKAINATEEVKIQSNTSNKINETVKHTYSNRSGTSTLFKSKKSNEARDFFEDIKMKNPLYN